jgi:hypothetical protein
MAIYVTAKEAYALFLQSDFWVGLSRQKRRSAGYKCERCGSKKHTQAHHRFYRDNWFDTLLEDLECLCRKCHRKHHGITTAPVTESYQDIQPDPPAIHFRPGPALKKKNKRKSKGKWKKRTYTEARQIIESMKPVTPWYYNSRPSNKWTKRGNSSN